MDGRGLAVLKKSIISNRACCYLCGSQKYLERHHIFGGADRDLSEEYGLWVYLCYQCHRGKTGVHNNYYLLRGLREQGQEAWMEKNGKTKEDFIKLFGRNYL